MLGMNLPYDWEDDESEVTGGWSELAAARNRHTCEPFDPPDPNPERDTTFHNIINNNFSIVERAELRQEFVDGLYGA